ncbi:MAG: sugar ABC transporter permease [Thermotogae bacterium]|nr:MAG: sugar ABC transporter permease [Thermotogota bacterium]
MGRKGKRLVPWLMVLPAIVLFLAMTIYPFGFMIWASFRDYDLSKGEETHFIGLSNYFQIFKDTTAIESMKFTAKLLAIAVSSELVLGTFIAFLIRGVKGERAIRSALIIPMMVPPAVSGVAWKMLYNFAFGPVNWFLSLFGISKISWLGNSFYAQLGIIMIDIWQWTPFVFLMIYAGLQTIPQDLIDAARVDGAGWGKVFLHIELPLLRPLILVALVLRIIDCLKTFDIVFMTTWGGPGSATHTYSFYVYKVGVSFGWNIGYASALSVILLIVSIILVNIVFRIVRMREQLGFGGE